MRDLLGEFGEFEHDQGYFKEQLTKALEKALNKAVKANAHYGSKFDLSSLMTKPLHDIGFDVHFEKGRKLVVDSADRYIRRIHKAA